MAHILIFIHWFVLVFTFGNVELVTIDNSKSNDVPIEELNGYTLREVFENLRIPYVRNMTINSTTIKQDNIFTFTTDNENVTHYNGIVFDTGLLNANDKLYINFETIDLSNLTDKKVYYETANPYSTSSFINYFNGFNSFIYTRSNVSMTTFNYSGIFFITDDENVTYQIYEPNVYNLTKLGIQDLTLQEMDHWFNVYQENVQREISDTYDYIENELTTNDLIYIVLFALLWGLAIKIVKGVM